MKKIFIAPSLLSADFANLAPAIQACKEGGAEVLHVDVMDGHFVPNITIGVPVTASLRKATDLIIDCHLMIEKPERYISAFAKAGADWISVHIEACTHLHRTLTSIREEGKKAGLAVNPLTPLSLVYEALEYTDFLLLMSVNPGFGGQSFIENFYQRCRNISEYCQRNNLDVPIQVDGGVTAANAEEIIRAGASILVSGSGVFYDDPRVTIPQLRKAAERGLGVTV